VSTAQRDATEGNLIDLSGPHMILHKYDQHWYPWESYLV